MDDETLLKTMKNGLMIAGHELGPVGDHWPAINALRNGLDKEFEELRRDEAVLGELEFHLAEAIRQLEEAALEFTPEEQVKARKFIKETWEHYYSIFESVAPSCEPAIDDLLTDEQKKAFKSFDATMHILSRMGGRA